MRRLAAFVVGACLAGPALAENVTFNIKSNHPNKVQLEFYSQSRSHAWPGGNQAYNLNDYDTHSYRLNCNAGEKICYGAWVSGNRNKYWGVGLNNRQRCSNCCVTCNGGSISFTLNP